MFDSTDKENGFWKLQRAYNYLMQSRSVGAEISALRQIANCQRAVIGEMRHPAQVPMFELLTHRNGRTASEYGNDEIRWPDGLQHY